jgi:hypothetical protein
MMKYVLFVITIYFTSCSEKLVANHPSASQLNFQSKINRYDSLYRLYDIASNPMSKSKFRETFLDSLNSYLVEQKYILNNIKVKLTENKIHDIQGIRALVAEFKDENDNEYWMEFDYKPDSIKNLQTNPAYTLIKDMPIEKDTVLSFFYLGDIKWKDSDYDKTVRLQVVPFPKDYNFDSSRNVNKDLSK